MIESDVSWLLKFVNSFSITEQLLPLKVECRSERLFHYFMAHSCALIRATKSREMSCFVEEAPANSPGMFIPLFAVFCIAEYLH